VPGAFLAVFTLLALGFLAYFEWTDKRPPTYDDAWYLETSLRMYSALAEGRLIQFLYEYTGAFGGSKAPLISVLPLPFYFLFGKQTDPTFWVNGLFLVAGSLCLYGLVRRWYGPLAALAAVAAYQTFPIVAGLSRAYMTDYGLAALVIVFLYCLAAPNALESSWRVMLLGVLLGLGLLMKILFPAFVAGPLLVTWLEGRKRGRAGDPKSGMIPAGNLHQLMVTHPLLWIAFIGALIASSWYAVNGRRVLAFAWGNSFGPLINDYRASSLAGWLVDLADEGLSPYYALGLLVLAPAALAIVWRRGEAHWKPRHALLLAWFAPAAVAVAAVHHADLRLVMPILPVAAIILGRSIAVAGSAATARPWARVLLVGALFVLPLYGFARLTFGWPAAGEALYSGSYWYRSPDREGQWNQVRILETLRELTPAALAGYEVVVGVEHPYLNANLLNYLKFRDGGPFSFQSLGYAETSVDRAAGRIQRPRVRFLLIAEGFQQEDLPEFLNRVNGAIMQRLDENRLPFQYRTTVPLTDRISIRLYERTPAMQLQASRGPA
jgi:4-amino-4-deoxy-L-arabinose transferase-like glycosyltransferase